jgi:hypothetical protein
MWMTMMIWPVVSSLNKAGDRSIVSVSFSLKYFYMSILQPIIQFHTSSF